MALHVIIPARYGSSRFPGKPLAIINGMPMIQHVIKRASCAKDVQTVAVATDDDRIKKAVEDFGGIAVMTSSDIRTGSDRVFKAAEELGLKPDDIIVNVQGDQPLLPPDLIDKIASPLFSDPQLGMSTPVVAIKRPEEIHDPNHVKVVMDKKGNALYFSRATIPFPRDGGKVTYYKHLGVYGFRKSFLEKYTKLPSGHLEEIEKLEQLRALEHGYTIRCVETEFDSPEVDCPKDAERVAEILAQKG